MDGQTVIDGDGLVGNLRMKQSGLPHMVDPLQTTFRGGKDEPLHGWFPYLEGYSPQFVDFILDTYAPYAGSVLDPFGGTGTTGIASSRRGLVGGYCEVNPVLRAVAEAKFTVLKQEPGQRRQLKELLKHTAHRYVEEWDSYEPSEGLRAAYESAFTGKASFDGDVFESVLALRTFIDTIPEIESALKQAVEIAAISSLVPVSNLKRSGDLRFRTPRELGSRSKLIEEFPRRLTVMADDLIACTIQPIGHSPRLVSEDAKDLGTAEGEAFEVAVTSPPYLNGTNYFRNTRLELWFMGHLTERREMRRFRTLAITSGISDVEAAKVLSAPHPSVERVAKEVADNAYDQRIPQMILGYFSDMETVLRGVFTHLVPDAVFAVDIGDSQYNGIHVPTDYLLADIARSVGFECEDHRLLRQRRSYNGSPLTQVLLVLRKRD